MQSWIKNYDLLCWESLLLFLLRLLRCLYLHWLLQYWWLGVLVHFSGCESCHWIGTKFTKAFILFLFFLHVSCIEVKLNCLSRSLLLLNCRLTHAGHCSSHGSVTNSIVDITIKFTFIILRTIIKSRLFFAKIWKRSLVNLLLEFLLTLGIVTEVTKEVERLLLSERLRLSLNWLIWRLLGRLLHSEIKGTRILLSWLLISLKLRRWLWLFAWSWWT